MTLYVAMRLRFKRAPRERAVADMRSNQNHDHVPPIIFFVTALMLLSTQPPNQAAGSRSQKRFSNLCTPTPSSMRVRSLLVCSLAAARVQGFNAPGKSIRSSLAPGRHDTAASTTVIRRADRCRGSSCKRGLCMTVTPSEEVQAAEAGDHYKSALIQTGLSMAAAGVFGAGIGMTQGTTSALEFFAGYVVEQSLSIDNIFVFLLLFEYFKVPFAYEERVLRWGIIGAMVMRAGFIAAGEIAMETFQPVLLVFAGVLLVSAFKLLTEGDAEEDENLSDNQIVALSKRLLKATDQYDGNKFFTMIDGVRRATPLLLVLVCVELSDIVFAVDSIPAVFGVTKNPFIVYTSNIFAIINLRSLFTVLASAVNDLPYLKPAVACVLAFVGAKLGAEYFGYTVSTGLSLGVISAMLSGGVGLSLYERKNGAIEQESSS